jgi:hypothetical protein
MISIEDADNEESNWESFLRSFTLFPKLPAELRVAIWNLILPGSRFVEIETTVIFLEEKDEASRPKQDYDVETWHARGIEKAPLGFFVCRESRAEVLKRYTPLKSTDGFPTLLVNFKRDVICFRFWQSPGVITNFLDDLSDDKLEKDVAYLLVDEDGNPDEEIGEGYSHDYWIDQDICRFQGLKEILLVPHCSTEECQNKIVGFTGSIKRRVAKRFQLDIERIFGDIEEKNPSWNRPKASFGKVLLDSSSEA